MDRRHFLRSATAGTAGVASGLLGAGASRSIAANASVTGAVGLGPGGAILTPGTLPDPSLAPGTDTIPQIEHVVVLVMENHSFDDHFGMLQRGDGFTLGASGTPVNWAPDPAGGLVQAFQNRSPNITHDGASNAWDASHTCWNGGRMDGWVKGCGPYCMGYWTGDDLPFYYSLMRQFPISDRYFSPVMAQTFPNRRFMIAATAAGDVSTSISGVSPTGPAGGTIFDLLDAHGISWKDYYPDLPTCALFLDVYIRAKAQGRLGGVNDFLADAAAGTLPAVSVVDPYSNYSEEQGDISVGEAFAARIITAVLESPLWRKTVLFYTYDEGGGWYDHVPPPPALPPDAIPPEINDPGNVFGDYDYLGFRVPFAAISAWSRRHYVSHTVNSHTSILRFIEGKWNLPALTYRDANSNDLTDLFDFHAPNPPFAEPPQLATPRNPLIGPLPVSSDPKTMPVSAFHPSPPFDVRTLPASAYHRDAPPAGSARLLADHASRFPPTDWSAAAEAAAGGLRPSSARLSSNGSSDSTQIASAAGALAALGVLSATAGTVVLRRRSRATDL